ncbi:molybdopterin synthase sulfur carrier subunit [Dictyobacter vulcani]|uniref:Molybdopterin synthase sulfur carrier subunit n=2 Tax=Dictyobacter vulcani TaxID=2607529 RepID=A0A5J4KS86_9CHLR|nr:molybdopterin synthase sulfur carrier subunit [Dictyobacter vulcani]
MIISQKKICYTLDMKIKIRYFASFRELIGQGEELLTVADATRVVDIRALLVERNPRLQPIMERSVNALNHRYVPAETVLHENDELVFIPPTGGGQ